MKEKYRGWRGINWWVEKKILILSKNNKEKNEESIFIIDININPWFLSFYNK